MTIQDGNTPIEDGTRTPRHHSTPGLKLAPVSKAPIARRGGVNLKPTGSLVFSALDGDEDWETPEASPLTAAVSSDWGDDDESSEGDWVTPETSPVVTSPVTPVVSEADWGGDESDDWETSPSLSPVTSPSPSPQVSEETPVAQVIPLRPASPRAPLEAPAPKVSPKAVSPRKSTMPTGPAGTPTPKARHRAGEPVKRSRPLRRPQIQGRDLEVLGLLSVMRVAGSQHLIKALESRESQYAVMESSTGVVPLSPAVLEKRLSILERGGFVKRWYPSAFNRSKPVWLSTNKGISITSYAGSLQGVSTRSTSVLETSLAHHLLISAEIARLAKGAIAVPDVIVKKTLSEAVELAPRNVPFKPEWDPSWMQPLTDAAHLAPCAPYGSPIEPDVTVVNEASNAIAFYVEVETSPKPLAVYEAKMRAYAASGRRVYFLVGTTAAVGQRDVLFITRRLEVARANLGLSEDLISIEKADLAWAHPDPAAHRAEAMGAAA